MVTFICRNQSYKKDKSHNVYHDDDVNEMRCVGQNTGIVMLLLCINQS